MNVRLAVKSPKLFACILAASCWLPATESNSDELAKGEKPTADAMRGKKAGEVRDANALKLKLVWCPPGKFKMGSPDSAKDALPNEKPQIDVMLTRGFWLGPTEVTQGQWEGLMATTPWGTRYPERGANYAATNVDWKDAMQFCQKLTDQEREAGHLANGWVYTLPTEAQWEYACRAATATAYSFGDDASQLSDFAWWGGGRNPKNAVGSATTEPFPHEVGLKKANAWGLFDMHGNVSEWCLDWYDAEPTSGDDPATPSILDRKVLRGGNWRFTADACRSAFRFPIHPANRNRQIGFRIALCEVRKKIPGED